LWFLRLSVGTFSSLPFLFVGFILCALSLVTTTAGILLFQLLLLLVAFCLLLLFFTIGGVLSY